MFAVDCVVSSTHTLSLSHISSIWSSHSKFDYSAATFCVSVIACLLYE